MRTLNLHRLAFALSVSWLLLFFLLTYRLGESQLVKIAQPFMLDTPEAGGLTLSTTAVGGIYGTLGVIALLLGGVLSEAWGYGAAFWAAWIVNLTGFAGFWLYVKGHFTRERLR